MTKYEAVKVLESMMKQSPEVKCYAARFAMNPAQWAVYEACELDDAIFSGRIIKESLMWLTSEEGDK